MKVTYLTEPFEHIIVHGLCSNDELISIDQEIISLYDKLLPPSETNAAPENDGKNYKKSGKGIFLDQVYLHDRKNSSILEVTKNIFSNDEIRKTVLELSKKSTYFKLLPITNRDSTLLQYYGHGDYYKAHIDKSIFTVVFTHYIAPKRFYGGNLKFPEYEYTIPLEYNTLIVFPSCIEHEVLPVTLLDKDVGMSGRFSISMLVDMW